MRPDPFFAYDAGGWRTARKPFRCMASRHCTHTIQAGEEYYDTGDCDGTHYFAHVRICKACADDQRARTTRAVER